MSMEVMEIKKKKKLVPVLRFKEFDGEWTPSRLGDGINLISGQHLTPAEYNNSNIGFPYFTGPSDFTDVDEKVSKWTNASNHLGLKDDVLITVKGNGVGKMAIQRLGKVAMGRQLMSISAKKYSSEFVYHFLLTKLNLFVALASGNLIPGLSRKDILTIKLNIPTLPEQKKIATFLSAIDKKIQQLTRKKALLEEYKKGLMQQLFSGALRFRPAQQNDGGEEGKDYPAWEEKRLGEVGEFVGGGTPSSKKKYWKGSIPWISSSDVKEHSVREIEITRYITEEAIIESATKLIPKNSVLIVSRVGIGKFAVATQDLCTSQDFTNLISSENSYFLAYYFKTKANRFISLSQGTSIKGFTGKDIRNLRFLIPSMLEQKKIANCLFSIDTKIETITTQITKTQTFKKGLLQQLFV